MVQIFLVWFKSRRLRGWVIIPKHQNETHILMRTYANSHWIKIRSPAQTTVQLLHTTESQLGTSAKSINSQPPGHPPVQPYEPDATDRCVWRHRCLHTVIGSDLRMRRVSSLNVTLFGVVIRAGCCIRSNRRQLVLSLWRILTIKPEWVGETHIENM